MPASDLALLLEAADIGGQIALDHFRTPQTVWHKDAGAGPVSEGDYAVDRALRDHLTAARPDYGWLSEETPDTADRLTRDRVFILDPIDGTRAYVEGQENWALSLAVVEHGRPTAAVVAMPAKARVYAAALGQGATRDGAPISPSTATLPGASLLAPRPSLEPQHWRGPVPGFQRHFRPSLAYRLALVAEGRFDAMLTLRDAWEWDIAAGALIVSEAGGVVTDRTGAALVFNSGGAKTPGVLAAGQKLHEEMTGRLAG